LLESYPNQKKIQIVVEINFTLKRIVLYFASATNLIVEDSYNPENNTEALKGFKKVYNAVRLILSFR
tara:strand:- start:673 stop:873 length:201 start_codon:yes stop_codon:yes gene_type:complete